MRHLAAIQGERTTVLFGTQCGTRRVQDNETFDRSVLEGTYCTCLAVAGRNVDLFLMQVYLFPYPLRVKLLLLLYIRFESLLKAGFGFAIC